MAPAPRDRLHASQRVPAAQSPERARGTGPRLRATPSRSSSPRPLVEAAMGPPEVPKGTSPLQAAGLSPPPVSPGGPRQRRWGEGGTGGCVPDTGLSRGSHGREGPARVHQDRPHRRLLQGEPARGAWGGHRGDLGPEDEERVAWPPKPSRPRAAAGAVPWGCLKAPHTTAFLHLFPLSDQETLRAAASLPAAAWTCECAGGPPGAGRPPATRQPGTQEAALRAHPGHAVARVERGGISPPAPEDDPSGPHRQ